MLVWVAVGGVLCSSTQGSPPMVLVAGVVVVVVGLGLAGGGAYGSVAGIRPQQAWEQKTGVPPRAVEGLKLRVKRPVTVQCVSSGKTERT